MVRVRVNRGERVAVVVVERGGAWGFRGEEGVCVASAVLEKDGDD